MSREHLDYILATQEERKYYENLAYLASRHVGVDKDDLLQDIWVMVLAANACTMHTDLRRCIKNSARNKAVSKTYQYAQGGRWQRVGLHSAYKTMVAQPCDIGDIDIQVALATLPSEDHDLVRMYYQEGFTQEEVGKRLGITGRTVRRRLVKIKKHLAEFMET